MKDNRTLGQVWADAATEFSGSWTFIGVFVVVCIVWIGANTIGISRFDLYPFLLFNLCMTLVSTVQSPLILLSQNRQNETDRETVQEIVKRLSELQKSVDKLTNQ